MDEEWESSEPVARRIREDWRPVVERRPEVWRSALEARALESARAQPRASTTTPSLSLSQPSEPTPLDSALQNIVGTLMPVGDVIALLTKHSCTNLTSALDHSASSEYPVANGGLGDVFKSRLIDGTPVAVKTIRAYENTNNFIGTYQKRAAKEIYTWSKCDHPNVVRLMGLAVFHNSLAMVSRWEEHGNLLHYLSLHQNVDRCQLSTSICAGLVYLHENKIVHGDLKGANVIIAEDGTPKLMDFGNASLSDATLQFTQTKSGLSLSARWTAPEILDEKSPHSTAGDIYSLGMTILETLTAMVPFPDKQTDRAVITAVLIRKKTPERPEKIIPETSIFGNTLWSMLTSCWSRNPKRRPTAKTVWDVMKPLTPEMLLEIKDEVEMDED